MSKEYQNRLQSEISRKADFIVDELPEFCQSFFAHMKTIERSARTRLQYAYDLRRFFAYVQAQAGFRDMNIYKCTKASEVLDKFSYEDIQEYLDTLNQTTEENYKGEQEAVTLSSSYKARNISSLRSFYRFCFRHQLIEKDMADLMEMPRVKNTERFALDSSQIQRLLKAVDEHGGSHALRDRCLITLLFSTGIRVSELAGIDISDVDFFNASIVITRKGGDQDITYFPQHVEELLAEYIDTRKTLAAIDGSNALFLSNKKKRISIRSIQDLVSRYAGLAGLSNMHVTPHTARRSFGTFLYEESGDIDMVADALNHKSIQTTRRYIKSKEGNKRKAQKLASGLFD
ncbi:MAG: tyrosine-type recombinase/integrase [Erysipelotrichaceae bacterium]|nr:tyrosine-type recombinase/integrase [Erysipelotrichaceae bacterium]